MREEGDGEKAKERSRLEKGGRKGWRWRRNGRGEGWEVEVGREIEKRGKRDG